MLLISSHTFHLLWRIIMKRNARTSGLMVLCAAMLCIVPSVGWAQGGDVIGSATPILSLPYADTGSTAMYVDANPDQQIGLSQCDGQIEPSPMCTRILKIEGSLDEVIIELPDGEELDSTEIADAVETGRCFP